MSQNVLFVSVNVSFDPEMDLAALEACVERAWALSVSKANACDRVVAVFSGSAIGAWALRGAFATSDETYKMNDGSTRPRIALSLGEPLPVLAPYQMIPSMRRGCAVVECEVPPLMLPVKPASGNESV